VAVITGGSSGIGRAVAVALAGQGWSLVLAARSLTALQETCAGLPGAAVEAVVADVGKSSDVERVFAAAVERFGGVDVVVNAVAAVGYGRFDDVPADIFDQVIVTNLLGSANVARVALRHFRAAGGGHLVFLGSLLGKIAVPYMSPYVVSKWAVHGLARTIRIEARQIPGVRVSMVSPGSVNTPAYLRAANYVGREGRPPPPVDPPEKVAKAVLGVLHRSRRDRSVGMANALIVFGFRLLPAVYDVLVGPLMTVAGLSRRAVPTGPGTVLDPEAGLDRIHGPWTRLGRRKA
jgi:NAD(P)-dependent dehydrogenase (short-subunit alcohol dehydrogenase family)